MKVRNPRTGAFDYDIVPLDEMAVMAEARRLRSAQPDWASLSPESRSGFLRALGASIDRHRGALGSALAADTGRRAISLIEIDGAIGMLNRWADRAPQLIARHNSDPRSSATPGIRLETRLVPYPLVGAISPWNFPLTLALIDAIPALAAGCAAMIKPSEITPRFIAPLRRAIAEVPEIAAVLSVIEGDGATGAALVGAVDYIAFTGSVATGRKVAESAARAFIPASLELGGKDPMIVLESADPEMAAAIALRSAIVNAGQACQSIERVYVARSIYAPFLDALVAGAERVRLNVDEISSGDIGPFIFDRQATIVQAQIDDALEKGARLLTGGRVEDHGGLWLRPTVLTDVTADMAILAQESFGPVIPVIVFDAIDEAVMLANLGDFGLSAAVIGDPDMAIAVAERLRAGAVSVNDGSLTSMVWDAEKASFGLSGMGASRMGDSGLMRFFRKQALIQQMGTALPIDAYAEETRQ